MAMEMFTDRQLADFYRFVEDLLKFLKSISYKQKNKLIAEAFNENVMKILGVTNEKELLAFSAYQFDNISSENLDLIFKAAGVPMKRINLSNPNQHDLLGKQKDINLYPLTSKEVEKIQAVIEKINNGELNYDYLKTFYEDQNNVLSEMTPDEETTQIINDHIEEFVKEKEHTKEIEEELDMEHSLEDYEEESEEEKDKEESEKEVVEEIEEEFPEEEAKDILGSWENAIYTSNDDDLFEKRKQLENERILIEESLINEERLKNDSIESQNRLAAEQAENERLVQEKIIEETKIIEEQSFTESIITESNEAIISETANIESDFTQNIENVGIDDFVIDQNTEQNILNNNEIIVDPLNSNNQQGNVFDNNLNSNSQFDDTVQSSDYSQYTQRQDNTVQSPDYSQQTSNDAVQSSDYSQYTQRQDNTVQSPDYSQQTSNDAVQSSDYSQYTQRQDNTVQSSDYSQYTQRQDNTVQSSDYSQYTQRQDNTVQSSDYSQKTSNDAVQSSDYSQYTQRQDNTVHTQRQDNTVQSSDYSQYTQRQDNAVHTQRQDNAVHTQRQDNAVHTQRQDNTVQNHDYNQKTQNNTAQSSGYNQYVQNNTVQNSGYSQQTQKQNNTIQSSDYNQQAQRQNSNNIEKSNTIYQNQERTTTHSNNSSNNYATKQSSENKTTNERRESFNIKSQDKNENNKESSYEENKKKNNYIPIGNGHNIPSMGNNHKISEQKNSGENVQMNKVEFLHGNTLGISTQLITTTGNITSKMVSESFDESATGKGYTSFRNFTNLFAQKTSKIATNYTLTKNAKKYEKINNENGFKTLNNILSGNGLNEMNFGTIKDSKNSVKSVFVLLENRGLAQKRSNGSYDVSKFEKLMKSKDIKDQKEFEKILNNIAGKNLNENDLKKFKEELSIVVKDNKNTNLGTNHGKQRKFASVKTYAKALVKDSDVYKGGKDVVAFGKSVVNASKYMIRHLKNGGIRGSLNRALYQGVNVKKAKLDKKINKLEKKINKKPESLRISNKLNEQQNKKNKLENNRIVRRNDRYITRQENKNELKKQKKEEKITKKNAKKQERKNRRKEARTRKKERFRAAHPRIAHGTNRISKLTGALSKRINIVKKTIKVIKKKVNNSFIAQTLRFPFKILDLTRQLKKKIKLLILKFVGGAMLAYFVICMGIIGLITILQIVLDFFDVKDVTTATYMQTNLEELYYSTLNAESEWIEQFYLFEKKLGAKYINETSNAKRYCLTDEDKEKIVYYQSIGCEIFGESASLSDLAYTSKRITYTDYVSNKFSILTDEQKRSMKEHDFLYGEYGAYSTGDKIFPKPLSPFGAVNVPINYYKFVQDACDMQTHYLNLATQYDENGYIEYANPNRNSNAKIIISMACTYFGNSEEFAEEDTDKEIPEHWYEWLWEGAKALYKKVFITPVQTAQSKYTVTQYIQELFNLTHMEFFELDMQLLPTEKSLSTRNESQFFHTEQNMEICEGNYGLGCTGKYDFYTERDDNGGIKVIADISSARDGSTKWNASNYVTIPVGSDCIADNVNELKTILGSDRFTNCDLNDYAKKYYGEDYWADWMISPYEKYKNTSASQFYLNNSLVNTKYQIAYNASRECWDISLNNDTEVDDTEGFRNSIRHSIESDSVDIVNYFISCGKLDDIGDFSEIMKTGPDTFVLNTYTGSTYQVTRNVMVYDENGNAHPVPQTYIDSNGIEQIKHDSNGNIMYQTYEVTVRRQRSYTISRSCSGHHLGFYCGGHYLIHAYAGVMGVSDTQWGDDYSLADYDDYKIWFATVRNGYTDEEQIKKITDRQFVDMLTEVPSNGVIGSLKVESSSTGGKVNLETKLANDSIISYRLKYTPEYSRNYEPYSLPVMDIFVMDEMINHYSEQKGWCVNGIGWSDEEILITLMKYNLDWKDTYDIIATESLGGFGMDGLALASADVETIMSAIRASYPNLSAERLECIQKGLECVGYGGYDQNYHTNIFPFNKAEYGRDYVVSQKDNLISDCSGFVSNIWYNRLHRIYSTHTFKDTFQQYFHSFSEAEPGDILLHWNSKANHALLYIGYFEYNGETKHWSIDCTSLTIDNIIDLEYTGNTIVTTGTGSTRVGNIYLRSRSYYNECSVLKPDEVR